MGIKLHQHTRDDEMFAKGFIRVDKTVNNRAYFEGDPGYCLDYSLVGKTYFYVMKWQARNAGSNIPISTGTGLPWASVTQVDSKIYSTNAGYHLITNDEWMAIARDIESVPDNYVSGVLKRGNVGDTATGNYNGADPEEGVTNSLATLYLSNGQTIHHFSGNVWEWVDYTIPAYSPAPNPGQPKASGQTTGAWNEFSAITSNNGWGTILGYENVGPKNTSLNGSTGVGRIYSDPSLTTVRALRRGGLWDDAANAGVFALRLSASPASTHTGIGFRCAR